MVWRNLLVSRNLPLPRLFCKCTKELKESLNIWPCYKLWLVKVVKEVLAKC